MPSIFDSHTHVHFPAYDNDRDEVIKRAQSANVKMIAVGTQLSTSKSAIELAEKYPDDVWAAVGFHPSHIGSTTWHHDEKEQSNAEPEKFDASEFKKLATHPKVVAVGECGFDYYRLVGEREDNLKNKSQQIDIFFQQVQIANEVNKPLMIHCRPSKGSDDAYEDLLVARSQLKILPIVHFYVGSLGVTQKLLGAGFYFTFGGVITFARDYDEVIKCMPLDRILLETDAPYVAPASYRGRRNEPSYIIETARKLAEIKGIDYDDVVATVFETNKKVFGVL
ncbi:MAG: TatD family hydrolase [bacterium]|nr:TatD family hydrolase [bacterium]